MKFPFGPSRASWSLRSLTTTFLASIVSFSLLHSHVFITPTAAAFGSSKNKVLLKDVKTLTLRQGRQTNYRRTYAVPQLKCVGGNARWSDLHPDVVQCTNAGSDGIDVQWECKADLPKEVKFGAVEIFCEGYDYPDDPYVLKGSCGLEYELKYTGYREGAGNFWSSDDPITQWRTAVKRQSRADMFFSLLTLGFFGFIVYSIIRSCVTQHNRGANHGYREPPPPYHPTDPNSRGGGGGGGGPGFGGGPAGGGHGGPPSGYHKSTDTTSSSSGPGFWSGVGLGGLATYLATSAANRERQRDYAYDRYGSYGAGPSTGFGGGGWDTRTSGFGGMSSGSSSRSSSNSNTRTATGYGGTRRR